MAAVAALALVAGSAQAQTDTGWDTKYGIMFQAQNIFSDGNGFLTGYPGGGAGVGVQYNLAPTTAVRLFANIGRDSNPVTETDFTNGTTTRTAINVPGPDGLSNVNAYRPTSTFDVGLGATYLIRMTTSALSPYIGAGASLGYSSRKSQWDGTVPGDLRYDTEDSASAYGLGGVGVLGLEWRVHKSIALFAEYGLNVNLFQKVSEKSNHTTQSVDFDGIPVADTTVTLKQESSHSRFFTFDTGLNQGGQLGLAAFF
jgi:opacity protein-like surface antigen